MVRVLLVLSTLSLVLAGCGAATTPSPTSATPGAASAVPASSGSPASPGASADPAAIGQAFVEALARGDDASAQAMEDGAMVAAAPASKLGQLWDQFVAQFGPYKIVGAVTTAVQAPYVVATVHTIFADGTVALAVTVDSAGRVAGLHVASVPASASGGPSASPAAYVRPGSFSETSITVGAVPWTLPGTLTMPRGTGPFPAAVLVAGSGPEDRDETFGPNKPFRDLAWGLASAGIAVLRYDKRTLVYAKQLAADTSITVRQETTDDAEAAVALLRRTPKVDPSRVFLVGHSLGAYLAPRMGAQIPGELAGIAMLEAPSTPLPRLILMQATYLASLEGSPSPQAEQPLAALRAQVALAESPDLSPSTPASELPLDTPALYWLDLQAYHPLAVVASLRTPIFFSQGGRDYQVPPSQLGPWKTALAGHSNVTFRTYPAMDHLLLDGSGPPTPAEYSVPGHVDAQLVADLAAWIKSA
ncbi:MAG: alpha/beta fold hydrolase [Candidatus Limnocylindrales bacterium]